MKARFASGHGLLAAALLLSAALGAQAKIIPLTKAIIDKNTGRIDFGVPTIPIPNPDGPGTIPWAHNLEAGDTIEIEGHTRELLVLSRINPPNAASNRVKITNKPGTQFIIDTNDVSFKKGLTMSGCSNFILTGTYVGTQHGIIIAQTPADISGVIVTQYGGGTSGIPPVGASDFEVSHIKIGHTGFAGVLIKCDDLKEASGFVMENVELHHLEIHDTGGEGMYVGSSAFTSAVDDPHHIHNLHIHDNKVTNTGWDGIQVGCATQNTLIERNVIKGFGLATTLSAQDEGMRINPGTAGIIRNNWIEGTDANAGMGILANPYDDSLYYNNVVIAPGENGIDINTDYGMLAGTTIQIFNNTIVLPGKAGIHFRSEIAVGSVAFNNIIADPGPEGFFSTLGTPELAKFSNLEAPTVPEVGFILSPDANKYRLSASATLAIDLGSTDSQYPGPATDYDGVARPQGIRYDIGAFEYVAVGASAPAITTQPTSRTVTVGASTTLTVAATGTAPLSYQWYKGGTAIAGATGASYTISPVQTSHAGGYGVTVTNSAGSATSNTATLTVHTATGLIAIAGYGQAGTAYCPATGTFNEQPTWSGGAPSGVSASPYTATGIAYANRHWYIDFGANWANVRITGVWTRYMPLTTASYSGLGGMWWDNDTDATNDGVAAGGLNFATAQGLNTGSGQPWVRDIDATAVPIAPQNRYLIVNTGSAPAARANEFAISGYLAY